MSDDEDVHSGEERPKEEEEETKSEEEEEEEDEPTSPAKKMAPPEDSGPSEAELAMQRRREQLVDVAGVDEQTMELLALAREERLKEEEDIKIMRERIRRRKGAPVKSTDELDEEAQELLEANKLEREKMEEEIQELRERSQQRKKEREQQEREMAERRSEEEARRKQEEEERKSKKDDEDSKRKAARDQKMAEFEKFKNPSKPNFVISKRDGVPGVPDDSQGDESQGEKKSKEQLEAEKRAILAQRIQPLDISGFDVGKLTEKAKELNGLIYRLESDKYDLEKRFKEQQYDMMELADKARQMNQVGRGGLKRVQLSQEEVDPIQEKFAGAPAKVEMYSKYERQKDKRKYSEKHVVFHGPTWVPPPDRVVAYKNVIWDENTGLPSYVDIPGMERPAEEGEGEEE